MLDPDLDPIGLFALRLYDYNVSKGHLRYVLRHLESQGLTSQDVYNAYRGFSLSEALILLDVDLFELYSLLTYFRYRVPASQRRFAARRGGYIPHRVFNDDGTVKSDPSRGL